MTAPSGPDADGTALIYIGYADVMRSLQLMELHLWSILALKVKTKSTEAQIFSTVEKWDGTTFGALVRGMQTQGHWPPGMTEDLAQVVELRNYLAHHFLREFFLAAPSPENFRQGSEQLLAWSREVDALDERLRIHAELLGVPAIENLDKTVLMEIDAARPRTWPLGQASPDTP